MSKIVLLTKPPTIKDPISGKDIPAPGYVALGGGYYDVAETVTLPDGVTPLSTGKTRYKDLPAAHKPKVMLTEVLRSADVASPDLKARIMGLVKVEIEARGETLAKYTPAQIKAFIIKKVNARLAARQEGKVVRARVKMNAVPPGDIEDTSRQGLIPHRWLGETDSEETPVIPPPLP